MYAQFKKVQRTIGVLFQLGDTIELRCVGYRQSIVGYYRDFEKLASDAVRLNHDFNPKQNVFVSLNPVDAQLFARRADQFGVAAKGDGSTDRDIPNRRWLLIDVDAIRPTGISATDGQKQAAIDLAKTIYAWLCEQYGTDSIVCADSGNGAHMLLRLAELANDEYSRWICERFLQLLDDRFSNKQAKVDRATFNAARICTLYGTTKRKGSDIPEQPHRPSKLLHVPNPLLPIDWSMLVALVEQYAGSYQPKQPSVGKTSDNGSTWNVPQVLTDRQIEYTAELGTSASGEQWTTYSIDCPFSSEHSDGFALFQWDSGAIAAKCHHDRCEDKGWAELKQIWNLEGGQQLEQQVLASLPRTQPTTAHFSLEITAASTIAPQSVDWLWPGKIALGKLTIVAGYGGCGKTFLMCDLAARISAGTLAPDGQQLDGGRVLIATGEDGLADTLVPRLIAHEADLTNIDFIEGVRAIDGLHLLDLLQHIEMLRDAIASRPGTKMLLVDPISSFMGAVDSHKATDVRRVLSAVAKMAEDHAIAFVGIHHLRKSAGQAIHAITGSQAFSDAVRTVWLIGLDQDDPKRRLMLPSKNNLAETHGSGLAYTITSGRVVWESSPVLMAADDLLCTDHDPTPRQEAKEWLQVQLENGPQVAQHLLKAGKADGIAERTLRRAKKDLDVKSIQLNRQWSWELPDNPNHAATSVDQNP